MAVLSRGESSHLPSPRLERRAKSNLAGDVRYEKAFSRAGAMFHARRHFLADIAALLETDAHEFLEPRVQSEDLIGRNIGAVRNAKLQAMRIVIARGHVAGCVRKGRFAPDCAKAEIAKARIGIEDRVPSRGDRAAIIPHGGHGKVRPGRDVEFRTKPVKRQALDEIAGLRRRAIDE